MRPSVLIATLGLCALLAMPRPAVAEDEKWIQLSLFSPVQIFPPETSVKGLRLSLYGKNENVTGVDLGVVMHTTGSTKGVQYGFAGLNDGDFTGWQWNVINFGQGYFTGLQTGFFNVSNGFKGFEVGFVNTSEDVTGLQLGFINVTENLNGLQIGIINVARGKQKFRVLPIVNWSF